VTEGLNAGDKVITEGIGRLKPNDQVKPVPAGSPQKIGGGPVGGKGGKGKGAGASDGTGR
jgi:membrane fusion protein (multidrug efflux system)